VPAPNPLLDLVPPTPAEFAATEAQVARILRTDGDVVIMQAEAQLALEAAVAALVRPGLPVLALSSGAYGAWFARDLAARGADVETVEVDWRDAVSPAAVQAALERRPETALVAFVHGESLSGNVNPAEEICAVVQAHGALCLVDAVASLGAHPLETDRFGIDLNIAGPQKALAGSSGTSLVSVSERAWQAMRDNPGAPRGSFGSLLDWKDRWIDAGRQMIPGTPSILEMHGLAAACTRVLEEGVDEVVARHVRVAAGVRAGIRALGLETWPLRDAVAANAVTVFAVPDGLDAEAIRDAARPHGLALVAGRGPLAGQVVRIDHMGRGATTEHALAAVAGVGRALQTCGRQTDLAGALAGATDVLV
jgi:aspartate aminotransferase-like enzyme